MIRNLFLFACMAAVVATSPCRAEATAGFAEWDIPTPMGNSVNHTDPFIDRDGTSIRPAGHSESDVPYVVKVETWIFYLNYIAGYAEKGFFLFNETTKEVEYFKDEAEQSKRLLQKGIRKPISRPYDGGKGWREVWTENRNPALGSPQQFLEKTLQEIEKNDWFQKLSEDQKALQKEMMRKRMDADAQFLREEYDFYEKLEKEIDGYPEFQQMGDQQKEQIKKYIRLRLKASTFKVEESAP